MRYDFLGMTLLEVHDSAQAVFLPGVGDFAGLVNQSDKAKKIPAIVSDGRGKGI